MRIGLVMAVADGTPDTVGVLADGWHASAEMLRIVNMVADPSWDVMAAPQRLGERHAEKLQHHAGVPEHLNLTDRAAGVSRA
jgi:hypothetical protein